MDLVIAPLDELVLTPHVYPAWLPPDALARQCVTVYSTLVLAGLVMYFVLGGLSYKYLFDHDIRRHPKFLPNQELFEIRHAMWATAVIPLYTTPFMVAEMRGHSKLYDRLEDHSALFNVACVLAFLSWNDCFVYWIHRALHDVPFLYKHVHKLVRSLRSRSRSRSRGSRP